MSNIKEHIDTTTGIHYPVEGYWNIPCHEKNLQCKRLHPNAQLLRWNVGDAGYDIFSIEPINLEPQTKVLVSTGLAVRIPDGWVGIIKPRSGLSCKTGLTTDAGVIDASYRGELKILLSNVGKNREWLDGDTRIAQLVIMPCFNQKPEWVEELDETTRGTDGFGSTGTK